jgi:transposase
MYYPTMASIVYKKKKGREYAYWVRSARVEGKPRIVEQVYLGPKERFLEETKAAYARGATPGPFALRRVQTREFGASAYLWSWIERLGLAEIVDRHVPPPPARRRTQLSVGQYLALAAVNRAVAPRSKRSFYEDWYQGSAVSRRVPAKASQLTSQRFWDHMDMVEPAHIERIQRDVLGRVAELFPLGRDTVLYDTTNFFTFLDSFNDRSELAQRGDNKQKRQDLRQLSLALFEDEETGIPLYHQCYAGNRHDATHFPEAQKGLLAQWLDALGREAEQLTLVFDRGSPSKKNFRELDEHAMHFVSGVPAGWVPDLLEVERDRYGKLELPGTKHVKVYRERREVLGVERSVLVVFSPTLFTKQRRTLAREQAKLEARLQKLAQKVAAWRERGRSGRGHSEAAVRDQVRRWTAREHLREFLDVELEVEDGKVVELHWRWDSERKRAIQRRHLGKQILVTSRHDWDSVEIVRTYRRLTRTEHLFRIAKSRPGVWWPLFHWTDSKIRVHALYCFLALVLLAILRLELQQAGVPVGVDRAIRKLTSIEEALVVYQNGAADRTLTELDKLQREIAQATGLLDLATEWGTTVTDGA